MLLLPHDAPAAVAAYVNREAHKQDVSELQSRLSKAQEEITEVETAYEELRCG
jgi:Tfp pilus assembly protein FimV